MECVAGPYPPCVAVNLDGPSVLWGMAAAFPLYWFLDNYVVPRFAHLLAAIERHRERG